MIGAVFVCLYHITEKRCQVGGVSRRAELIGYDGYFLVCLPETEHGLHEVVPVLAEDPGNAHDEIFPEDAAHRFFPFPFCLSVDVERMDGVVHFMGSIAVIAEDIVRADVDHLRIDLPADFRNVRRAVDVHVPALFRLVFRFIYRRVGRAVNDRIRLIRSNVSEYSLFIRDV